ncbi:VWA domain-containing protein [Candidatus Woesearchaeota archaeon]|nr:VWA domain-containing protein [Candidatus Woesearchaeota archaeon]
MVQFVFEQSGNLWFLLSIPLLLLLHYYFTRHIKRKALLFANFRAMKRITGKRLMTRNKFILVLRMILLASAVLAVSGTVMWYSGTTNEDDFVIAIDTSSSMTSEDVAPSRIEAAKKDATIFVDSLDSTTRVGVVVFSGISLIRAIPTTDKDVVREAIDSLEPLQAGGTDIPGAIITSTNLLLDNSRGRAIILITDGSNTIETFLDASMQRALEYAQEHHIKVHTIGIGTNAGPIGYLPTYYNVSAVYNEENLLQIANATGGTFIKAETSNELINAFQIIADKTEEQLIRRDLRAPLMMIALLLLFAEWILINTRFKSVP